MKSFDFEVARKGLVEDLTVCAAELARFLTTLTTITAHYYRLGCISSSIWSPTPTLVGYSGEARWQRGGRPPVKPNRHRSQHGLIVWKPRNLDFRSVPPSGLFKDPVPTAVKAPRDEMA